MIYYFLKVVISAVLIVTISEISKRSSFFGALVASIPLISVMAILWIYIDTKDIEKISSLSTGIFWMVLPSLALFISLPVLLKQGLNFYLSLGVSIAITIVCYWLMISILNYYGIKL
ncbi:MAG: DUF3147 family protein [Candidatus Thioglobus sp.]|nr:DUF3147 family protein [Candidatus Thioglobus pontius]MBL6976618.1 DUF3147 family protein [Candidatus Thioglobus sp.]MBL6984147.1 DUF3147 family protein [Candidatus Thioglobus sp.]